jgi:hypothetical protein
LKPILTTATAACIVVFGLALSPAIAQDRPGATPPKTMGDEGKLPATKSMSGQVPEMKPDSSGK